MNQRPTLLKPVGPESLADEENFWIGHLFVRPSLLEVRAGDAREILEPRVMQVLVALAGANGSVVSRDELIRQCWGGRIVGEDSINRCVSRIRRLADLSGCSAFEIETIPRVGYRLLASKTGDAFESEPERGRFELQGGAYLAPTHPERTLPASRFASNKVIWAVLISVAVVAGAAAMLSIKRSMDRDHVAPGKTESVAAVLPFTALSAGRNAQIFADQISSDVASALGRTDMDVIAPERSFQFRGSAKAGAARALRTDILVDGDVRNSGTDLVVSVRVEDVPSGQILVSKDIERAASEAADLPDQVATFVAGALGSDISVRVLNSRQWPAHLRATILRAFFQCPYRVDPLCAYEIGRNLVRVAPENTLAQTMLAIETTNVLDRLPEREKSAAIATARKAAWTAIRQDPHFGAPYIALGALAPDRTATEAYLRRGLAIEPDSPSLAGYLSGLLLGTGRSEEGVTVIQKVATRYDFLQFVPLTQIWLMLQVGYGKAAHDLAHHGQKLWPERGLFVLLLFEGTMLDGNPADAEALLNDPVTGPQLRDPPSRPTTQDIVQALRTRQPADIEAVSRDCARDAGRELSYQQVCVLALVLFGRLDDAFRLPIDDDGANVLFFPQMAPLRADPRFRALAEKLGLFAYWKKSRTRPDFCATEHVPVCQALSP